MVQNIIEKQYFYKTKQPIVKADMTEQQRIEEVYGCPIDWQRSHIVTAEEVGRLMRPRPIDAHKGTFGHALLIAGKRGMAGAAILAARAALRSGVGLLSVHTPTYNIPIIQGCVPEAIISEDPSETHFTALPDLQRYSAIAIGPGLGIADDTCEAIALLMERTTVPIVIDADALNILGSHRKLMGCIPAHSIVTPHPRELQRLAGEEFALNERLRKARTIASKHQLYVVVKGAYTAIVMPDGEVAFNPTGNAGMATAGSGDTLTGIIVALLAQHYSPQEACKMGVYVHGLAGDMALEKKGSIGLIASDIVDHLPQAWRAIEEEMRKRR